MIMQNALVATKYFESRNFRYFLSKKRPKRNHTAAERTKENQSKIKKKKPKRN